MLRAALRCSLLLFPVEVAAASLRDLDHEIRHRAAARTAAERGPYRMDLDRRHLLASVARVPARVAPRADLYQAEHA